MPALQNIRRLEEDLRAVWIPSDASAYVPLGEDQ